MASLRIELRGAGGEPVDLARTLLSHGVAELPPNAVEPDGSALETVLPAGGKAWLAKLSADGADHARLEARDAAPLADLAGALRYMLRLGDDLSPFYARAAGDPHLAWAAAGAGRMLRSPTVFEDLVKTICTTNCTWAATIRMVTALVQNLGIDGRTFPSPTVMADASDDFYRDVARTGYRGAYLQAIARGVADGTLDLEILDGRSDLPDEEVAERLLALPGVGPYAAAHAMMLLGRYGRLILDSWTRPTYARIAQYKKVKDSTIERRFRRYKDFAGLAFWLYITREWVPEPTTPR